MNKISFFTIFGYISFVLAVGLAAGALSWLVIDKAVGKPFKRHKVLRAKEQNEPVDLVGCKRKHIDEKGYGGD